MPSARGNDVNNFIAPSPVDGPSETLFLRNIEKLAEVAPDLHRLVVGVHDLAGRVVQDPSHPDDINFIVDGRAFYDDGLGARAHARREVDRYLAAPQRLYWAPIRDVESPTIDFVRGPVDRFVREHRLREGGEAEHHRASILVLFGLGLGEPLRLLLEARPFRHVIVVEPIAEFLWQSLWLQDWVGWFDQLAARGGSLKVVSGEDVEYLSTVAHNHLLAAGAIADGAYCYNHYESLALAGCVRRFAERIASISGEGYFEDELVMMTNSTRNFTRRSVKLVTNNRPMGKAVPAIICGAGPSLTDALPYLAALRDGAVLLSAGTTIGTLLRHGIVPDFHCEIENTEDNYEALLPVAGAHDLSGITLVGSATVDPRMPGLFGDCLLYVRDPGMSSALYGTDENAIVATTPNCVTLATRMVVRFGFREIYLFGTDFGSRRADQHHVADSPWMTDPAWRERYDRIAETMTMPMPGNFGGKVYTNRMLEYFLHSTQGLIAKAEEAAFFNCADGVKIEGAAPKLPSQVKFPIDRDRRLAAVEEIHDATLRYHAGGLIDRDRVRRFRRVFDDWIDGAQARLRELAGSVGDLIDVHDTIHGSLAQVTDDRVTSGVQMMVWGSLAMMFRHAFHYAIRNDLVADAAYKALTIEGVIAALMHMRQRLDAIMKAEFAFLANDAAPDQTGAGR
jgi:hypothetical protein